MTDRPHQSLDSFNGRTIVRLALVGEVGLGAVALGWIAARDIPLTWSMSIPHLALAFALVALSLGVNTWLFFGPRGPRLTHPAFAEFSHTIVVPLCCALSPRQALVVGLAAGLGEELLFRAALIPELTAIGGERFATVVSGILFGWLHFIGVARRFAPVVALYAVWGVLLGELYVAIPSIGLLVLVHAAYDWALIVIIGRWSRTRPGGGSEP